MLNLPKNIYIIALVMSLSFAAISMMVLIAGLLGSSLSDNPKLATLPLAMMTVGTAISTIPAAMIMQKFGRKKGIYIGLGIAIFGLILGFFSATQKQFWLFIIASIFIGSNAAFIQQGRFIIMENATNARQVADSLTLGLLANLLAAILGPAIGSYGRDALSHNAAYAGSFLLAIGTLAMASFFLTFYRDLPITNTPNKPSNRPIIPIITQPMFIFIAGSAAIGYAVMAFVMTATPISMHEMNGHELGHTRFVIQSHIVAMFLPSLLSGYLLKRGFNKSLIVIGLCLYIIVCAISYADQSIMHYWWALVFLGIGWNFIFMASTTMLPNTYSEDERFKAQAANDFSVFSFQSIAALAAGWVLFNLEWQGVIWIALFTSTAWLICMSLLNKAKTSP